MQQVNALRTGQNEQLGKSLLCKNMRLENQPIHFDELDRKDTCFL